MTSDSASRVTRSRWHLVGALALLAVVGVLRAQEPEAPASTPAANPPAPASNAPATSASGTPAAPTAAAPATGAAPAGKPGRTQDRFEPSEKVRADFDVSFHVDI